MRPSFSATRWWETDTYTINLPIPEQLKTLAGPHGVATVVAWQDGRTTRGWGLQGKDGEPGFMENYVSNRFNRRSTRLRYEKGEGPFAFVMRSMRIVVIDIDGKNGGLQHAAGLLGTAPPTLAETSKSGNGYHLFFSVEDEWDDEKGFDAFPDMIGIVQGVDIRSVGCVYHYDTQRWNDREIAPLPSWIVERLKTRKAQRDTSTITIRETLLNGDTEEIMIMQDTIIEDLKKPIPQGRRNTTLYALGHRLMDAEVDNWETLIRDRGAELGMPSDEVEGLITNVGRYAPA